MDRLFEFKRQPSEYDPSEVDYLIACKFCSLASDQRLGETALSKVGTLVTQLHESGKEGLDRLNVLLQQASANVMIHRTVGLQDQALLECYQAAVQSLFISTKHFLDFGPLERNGRIIIGISFPKTGIDREFITQRTLTFLDYLVLIGSYNWHRGATQ